MAINQTIMMVLIMASQGHIIVATVTRPHTNTCQGGGINISHGISVTWLTDTLKAGVGFRNKMTGFMRVKHGDGL